jgi:hypothetical protein
MKAKSINRKVRKGFSRRPQSYMAVKLNFASFAFFPLCPLRLMDFDFVKIILTC